jgi:hypothetical protein
LVTESVALILLDSKVTLPVFVIVNLNSYVPLHLTVAAYAALKEGGVVATGVAVYGI